MKTKSSRKTIFIILLNIMMTVFFLFTDLCAEKLFVSDSLIIQLREGPGKDYETIKTLRTDTSLELIEEKDEYIKVRTADGSEGWVAKRYTSPNTPKPIVIEKLNNELNRMKKKNKKFKETNSELSSELKTIRKDFSIAEKELKKIKDKHTSLLNQSQNVLSLISRSEKLKKENDNLDKKVKKLEDENQKATDETNRWIRRCFFGWIFAGAGVFIAGLFIGLALRKKSYY